MSSSPEAAAPSSPRPGAGEEEDAKADVDPPLLDEVEAAEAVRDSTGVDADVELAEGDDRKDDDPENQLGAGLHEWAGETARFRLRMTRGELDFVQRRVGEVLEDPDENAGLPPIFSVKMLHASALATSSYVQSRLGWLYVVLFMTVAAHTHRPEHAAWTLAGAVLSHGGHALVEVLLNTRLRAYALRRDLLLGRRVSGAEPLMDYPFRLKLHAESGASFFISVVQLGFYALALFADTTERERSWQFVTVLVIIFVGELAVLALKGRVASRTLSLLSAALARLEDGTFEQTVGGVSSAADAAAKAAGSPAAPAERDTDLLASRAISDELMAVLVYDGYRSVLRQRSAAVVPDEGSEAETARLLEREQAAEAGRLEKRRWSLFRLTPEREHHYASHAAQTDMVEYFREAVREGRHPHPENQANPYRVRLSHPTARESSVYAAVRQVYGVAVTLTLLIATNHAPWHTVAAMACHAAVWLTHAWLETSMNRSLRQYRFRWAYIRRPSDSLVREMLAYEPQLHLWMAPGAAVFTHVFFFAIFAMYVFLAPQHHRSLEGFLGAVALGASQLFVAYSMRSEALTLNRVFEHITHARCPSDEVEDELMSLLLNDESHEQLIGTLAGRTEVPPLGAPLDEGSWPEQPVAWTAQGDREHMRTLWGFARDGAVWTQGACSNMCGGGGGSGVRQGATAADDERDGAAAAASAGAVTKSASTEPMRFEDEV